MKKLANYRKSSNAITTGKSFGMVLMDHSLEALARNGTITNQEACERASNPAAMMQLLVTQ